MICLFLRTFSWDLRLLFVTVGLCLSSRPPAGEVFALASTLVVLCAVRKTAPFHGKLEDVRDRISSIFPTSCGSGLVTCFCTWCVSFCATSWMTSTSLFVGKHRAPCQMRDHLRSGPQSPCHPCPRGQRNRARPNAGRGIGIWSACVIRLLPRVFLWVRVDGSNCRGLSKVCPVFPL